MLEQFRSIINSIGVAHANRFLVNLGGKAQQYFSSLGRDYQFFAKEAPLPGQTLKQSTANYWGFNRTVASGLDYDALNLVFYCDSKYLLRKGFQKWQEDIYDKRTKTVGFFEEYKLEKMLIQFMDESGSAVHSVNIEDVWPESIGDMGYSWENDNTVQTFSVVFRYWEITPI